MPNWFPGTGFGHSIKALRKQIIESEHKPFYWAKEQIVRDRLLFFIFESLIVLIQAKGEYVDSFVSKNLLPEEGAVDAETEENIKWAGAALYVGGGDTVSRIDHASTIERLIHTSNSRLCQS